MNNINIIGRLVRDAELKDSKNGKKFAKFTVAVNRFNDETDFIDCILFNEKIVPVVEKYTRKGSQIGVNGSLQIGSYEKDGHKFKQPQINVASIDLLDGKQSNEQTKNTSENNPFDNNGTSTVNESELPF